MLSVLRFLTTAKLASDLNACEVPVDETAVILVAPNNIFACLLRDSKGTQELGIF